MSNQSWQVSWSRRHTSGGQLTQNKDNRQKRLSWYLVDFLVSKRCPSYNTSQNRPPGTVLLWFAEKKYDLPCGTLVRGASAFRPILLAFTLFWQCFHPFHLFINTGGQSHICHDSVPPFPFEWTSFWHCSSMGCTSVISYCPKQLAPTAAVTTEHKKKT